MAPSPPHRSTRSALERQWIVASAGVLTALAGLLFWWLPASRVLVGTTPINAWVPVHYQVSVFPAFGAFCGAWAVDVRARRWSAWIARAVMLSALCGMALARLAGGIALSGHSLCCAALIAECGLMRRRSESAWVVGLGVGGLAVTGWYKLAVWGDPAWFAVSAAAGAALGLCCGMAERFLSADSGADRGPRPERR